MNENFSKFKFYALIFGELLFLPLLLLKEELKNFFSSSEKLMAKKRRNKIVNKRIYINIHEWGGYDVIRKKKVNRIPVFYCGLKYQLERFKTNQCKYEKYINLTISEGQKCQNLNKIKEDVSNIDYVSNEGMDFSGYSFFYEKIRNEPNAFVILTNSSVNSLQTNFLNKYIQYMEDNTDVGMMGVSYCSKKMQTLVRNNFTPHLQSFFLLTTIDVLREIVENNGNVFPGKGISHKLLLIRKGEIAISQLVQKAGYNLAVVLESGSVFKFGKNSKFDNGYNRWKLKKTDVRLFTKNPNSLHEIS